MAKDYACVIGDDRDAIDGDRCEELIASSSSESRQGLVKHESHSTP